MGKLKPPLDFFIKFHIELHKNYSFIQISKRRNKAENVKTIFCYRAHPLILFTYTSVHLFPRWTLEPLVDRKTETTVGFPMKFYIMWNKNHFFIQYPKWRNKGTNVKTLLFVTARVHQCYAICIHQYSLSALHILAFARWENRNHSWFPNKILHPII